MKKTVLTFGLISGILCSILLSASLPIENHIGPSYYLGYTVIVASFLLVFFGIRSYRENVGGGQITFGKAFLIGISITLITCAFYVLTWEIIYFKFMPDFMDKYAAFELAKAKAAGASAAALQAQAEAFKKYGEMYKNPLYNSAMTFLEPFPVGLVITLISAAILRKKAPAESAATALPASS
ncbi:MAG TPA: DUF4199 domain-containing protein [Acidobacteriaceae bacterium]